MTAPCSVAEMIARFDVEPCGQEAYRADPLSGGRGVVDASQILAQSIVAASKTEPEKVVRSAHMLFCRMASDSNPLDIIIERTHSGRSFASLTATAQQEGRLCARGLLLMDSDVPDLVRYQHTLEPVPGPEKAALLDMPLTGRELRVVEAVDLMDPDEVAPGVLNVWARYDQSPPGPTLRCALVAHLINHFSIATSMLPHPGMSQALAHRSLSCGVLSLGIRFHATDMRTDQWLRYAHSSTDASHGLSQCHGHIATQDGQLIASFTQENMIREMPARSSGTAKADEVLL